MNDIANHHSCQRAVPSFCMKSKRWAIGPVPAVGRGLLAAAAVVGSLFAIPAAAEYTTFDHMEIASTTPECRSNALLDRPASWHAGEGAVVLLSSGPLSNAMRNSLVAELLHERVAVLGRAPGPCDIIQGREGGVVGGMHRALAALANGAGPVVAIGYGPGSRAVLDVLREAAPGQHGEAGSRYSAAVSIGDGAPVFVLGAGWRTGGQAGGLAPLCRALTAVAAGMGATLQRDAALRVAEACMAGMANLPSVVAGATR